MPYWTAKELQLTPLPTDSYVSKCTLSQIQNYQQNIE